MTSVLILFITSLSQMVDTPKLDEKQIVQMINPFFQKQAMKHEFFFDKAFFSFRWDNGTDPEFLLLMEACRAADGLHWHVAPVRFTWREVWTTHSDNEAWRASELNEFWTSQITRTLRNDYVSCATSVLDLNAIQVTTPLQSREEAK